MGGAIRRAVHGPRSGYLHPFLAIPLCVPCVACSAGDGTPALAERTAVTTEVSDSAGVEIVTNRGTGWSASSAWKLEPDLKVGDLDGPASFGRINWVSPGPGDGMLVLDGQTNLVHVFDGTGRHVREFGGEGDGPGEFRSPAVVTQVTGDRIAVAQGFPPILHWLTLEGTYRRSTRLPAVRSEAGNRSAGTFGLWQVTPGGAVFASAQIIEPGAEDGTMPVVLMHLSTEEGAPPDTILEWTWQAGLGDGPIRLFEPVHTWMPKSARRVLVAPGAPYEYREYDVRLGLQRVVRREVSPVSVTEPHRERALADLRASMEGGGAPAQLVDQMMERVRFEPELPAVHRIWVSEPDGRVWIGVYDPELEAEAGKPTGVMANAWDVFEEDGAYLGRIPGPHGFRLTVLTEDALYGVWKDELDVPFARRYRILRPEDPE